MASPEERTIARLGDMHEFDSLHQLVREATEESVKKLAQKTFALPEHHDRIEWEKLRAWAVGAEYVFDLVTNARTAVRKDDERNRV